MPSSRVPVRVARPGTRSRRGPQGPGRARRIVAWLALALLTASHAPAAGTPSAPPRILSLDTPPALERALRTALSPWGMQVAVHPSASDAEGLAARPERAGALARAFSAAALVWLEAASGERRLWLFDASKGTST